MGEAAAIEREAQIDQSQMKWIADHIVDDDRGAAHSQTFVNKPHDILWFQMMNEQATAYDVKTTVGKGQSDGVASYSLRAISSAIAEMRVSPIEKSNLKANPRLAHAVGYRERDKSAAGGDL